MSEYCRAHRQFDLDRYVLYSSAEPCAMCAGAIHWARISRIVYSVSQAMLQQLSGGRPKPGCASIINSGRRQVEIVGPLLPEEGLAVFEGYVFAPKAEWHGLAGTTVCQSYKSESLHSLTDPRSFDILTWSHRRCRDVAPAFWHSNLFRHEPSVPSVCAMARVVLERR